MKISLEQHESVTFWKILMLNVTSLWFYSAISISKISPQSFATNTPVPNQNRFSAIFLKWSHFEFVIIYNSFQFSKGNVNYT